MRSSDLSEIEGTQERVGKQMRRSKKSSSISGYTATSQNGRRGKPNRSPSVNHPNHDPEILETQPRRGSEDKFRKISDSARDAILIMDQVGRISYWNPAAEHIFGYTAEETLGRELHSLLVPERYYAAYRAGLARFRETGQGPVEDKTLELSALRKDGTEFSIELSVSSVNIGNEWNAVGILRDISDRKQTEERLKASEEKFRLLTETSIDFIFQTDREGVIQYCSPSLHQILGYEPQQVTGTNFLDYVAVSDVLNAVELLQSLLSGNRINLAEILVLSKEGAQVALELNAAPVLKDHLVVGVQGVARNITERARTQRMLEESEEKYRSLVENADDVIFIFQDNRIKFHNKKAQELTGYSAGELADLPFIDLVHPDDKELAKSAHQRRLGGEPLPRQTYRVRSRENREFWVETSGVRITWEGRPAVLSFVRDITERRALESQLRQAQKMEAIGQLAGGIAHDFNNVLAVITGYSETMMNEMGRHHPLHHMLEEIFSAGQRAARLTRQLLTFSRRQECRPRVLDLNTEIIDLQNMLHRLIGEDIDLQTDLCDDLLKVKADQGQMQQVIMNLVVNARDAMPDGGRMVIRTANIHIPGGYGHHQLDIKPGSYVMLALRDTGCGMDEETRNRIFEPFFTTKEAGRGTGLGLSTVYGIVKDCEGHVWVYTEPGKGTTFKIYLPASEEGAPAETSAQRPSEIPIGSETILLVEDDPALRKIVSQMLERGQYEVLEAEDPEEAIRIAEGHQGNIDLLVTDVVMPKMSGPELFRHLEGPLPEMKVLYMSGYTDEAIEHHGIFGAGRAFIDKPFSLREVLCKVRGVLDEHSRKKDPAGKSILVVDRDDPYRRMTARFLAQSGYEVEEARDAKQAVQESRIGPPDLILTEVPLLETEGIETIRALRDKYPSARIAALADARRTAPTDSPQLAARLGADCVFRKPFELGKLGEAVRDLLGS